MFETYALCDVSALGFWAPCVPLRGRSGGSFFRPAASRRRWHPLCLLVQGWVKSGQDSRRLSYLSALVAEGLDFATAVRGTSVSPCVSSVPLRVWTPSEALVCDVLCGSASHVL